MVPEAKLVVDLMAASMESLKVASEERPGCVGLKEATWVVLNQQWVPY